MGQVSIVDFVSSRPRQTGSSDRSVQAMAAWCEALSGAISFEDALSTLLSSLGAEAGMIVRTQAFDNRATRICLHDTAQSFAFRELSRSFADSYFGPILESARPGTMWLASAHADDATGDPALDDWQASRRFREFAVLVLANGRGQRDQIELHFRESLTPEVERIIAGLLPSMVRLWAGRPVGLVARVLLNQRKAGGASPEAEGSVSTNLLGVENPARLSRAEFRVCLMLSRGLAVARAAEELGLSEATVRSHLHNIYSKTGTSSLAELVFRLLAPPSAPPVPMGRIA